MEQNELKKAKIIPINGMLLCQAEEAKESPITMPDGSKLKTGFSVLVVRYIDKECKSAKVNDIVLLKPLPKKMGQIEIGDDKYIMCGEDEVGIILRRG